MFVKRGDAEILGVVKDDEHDLDDEGTRKAMDQAAEKAKVAEEESKDLQDNIKVN